MKSIELSLYTDIGGDGLTTAKFREAMRYFYESGYNQIILRMITFGGDVIESLGIVDCINEYKAKGVVFTGVNDCYVASAGMNILASCDHVYGTPNSQYLIHRAWMLAVVNSKQMDELKATLERATEPSIGIYINKTGKSREFIEELMDEERFLDVNEAIEVGFVDFVYNGEIDLNMAEEYLRGKESASDDDVVVISQRMLDVINKLKEV